MAEAKHTPGPLAEAWSAIREARRWLTTDRKEARTNALVALNAVAADPGRFDAMIAGAAPELLEALQLAEQALNKIRVCCHHTAWDATGPAVIAARAAIAKATGAPHG
jgi:hypothetical protein